MKKFHLALMCIVSLAILTACGGRNANSSSKNDKADGENTEKTDTKAAAKNAPESLARTRWFYNGDAEELELTLTEDIARLRQYSPDNGLKQYDGEYTYEKGKGTVKLSLDDVNYQTGTFSVSGDTMEFSFQGKTLKMKQKSI